MKVTANIRLELTPDQKEQFLHVRNTEGEETAFYFLEDLIKEQIGATSFVEMEYKE